MIQTDPRIIKIIIAILALSCALFFLFFRLGQYALWDDEATTALFAQSVWRTGDTHAKLDHNLIAYNSGSELRGLRNRYIPPLSFYLAAPFVGSSTEGGSAFAARLPFAICGFLTVIMMLFWLWKSGAPISTWLLTVAGILGNVSLMLYARQCRYYSVAILFVTVLAFLYIYRDGRKRTLLAVILISAVLLASNYMIYAAVYACFAVDYFFWGRKIKPLRNLELAVIFIPQIAVGVLLVSIYNPLGMDHIWGKSTVSWLTGKVILFLWNLRDLNSCEHGVGLLILLAPILYLYAKDKRLLRAPIAILTYILTVTLLSPQQVGLGLLPVATVRYLAPLIPLCIFTAVISIQALTVRAKWLAIPLAILAFSTNVLHGGPLVGIDEKTHFSSIIAQGRFRSTVAEFIQELLTPPPSAYRAAADWINENVEDKQTVAVMPGYATYPLMFHAPKATYAWQLKEKSGQFNELPDIHFFGKIPSDFIIAFGPYISHVKGFIQDWKTKGINYDQVGRLDVYWYDLTRPELFWHSFHEIENYSLDGQAIYIFKIDRK
ncbi:MAG: hypothetical protein KAS66_13435 [Candidatus Omnitrophica bacterium]|nr:hypothetical protein [Candidatus Omnitrophota bacterium]